MITPRRTRLIRVPDLHEFRRTIAVLCAPGSEGVPGGRSVRLPPSLKLRRTAEALAEAGQADGAGPAEAGHYTQTGRIVIVPTRGAATTLTRTLEARGVSAAGLPAMLTRDELYDGLCARLTAPPRRLSPFERDAMAQGAARVAAREVGDLPFTVRPGLVAEMLRFYDQLRRQSQQVKRFEELLTDALGGGDSNDRGADRLLRQTRFLAQAFRGYEQRAADSEALDEHRTRELLLGDATAVPVDHAIVTVPDWIADPAGLFLADFDLLNRLPNLAAIDIVSTEAVLASGFHERLRNWWPGIDEHFSSDLLEPEAPRRPLLVVPEPTADLSPLWFTHRDREEELIAVGRRLAETPPPDLDRVAVVFKRPLPYLYLAADTLGAAGVPFVVSDALPLAAEPSVTTVDLVLDALEADFPRDAIVALLRSPHLDGSRNVSRESIGALDRALSDARYLGGAERLASLADSWSMDAGGRKRRGADPRVLARPALEMVLAMVGELEPCRHRRTASSQLATVLAFLDAHHAPLDPAHPQAGRERRARGAVRHILQDLASAQAAHDDPLWGVADLATSVRRWIGDETFAPDSDTSGVRLLDDQAARYGEFDDMTIVGLIDSEWPDRSRRNIFYPPTLLSALNWPSEKDRRAAADARFLDLLMSSTARVELSAFLLDDESIVSRSIQLDEVTRARLSTIARSERAEPLLADEALALRGVAVETLGASARMWLDMRIGRTSADAPTFHGTAGPPPPKIWSVSALETYLGCPFKFFAQHVLRLEEEPDDEQVMDPRRQGQLVHEVFESFFREWQDAGRREIGPADLPAARELFVAVVDRALTRVPEGEAALERTRLLGSPAAAGLGEAVFRMEAERNVPVVARLLEHELNGDVTIQTDAGPRSVPLRGKADRLDLLGDGTFRLIDYKLGWPPDRGKALQLPIYALCAEQQLDVLGRRWTLGEAMYLAFKGPKRVVPLFSNDSGRADTLARAQQRLADALDAIGRGEFPPTPDDVYRCENCSFSAVCRKDYVGDL